MQSVPEDFVLASRAVPKGRAPVLALRRSPVTGLVFEALTVRYDAERSRNHWRRLDGSSVCDDGYDVLAWREAPDLLAYRGPPSASCV